MFQTLQSTLPTRRRVDPPVNVTHAAASGLAPPPPPRPLIPTNASSVTLTAPKLGLGFPKMSPLLVLFFPFLLLSLTSTSASAACAINGCDLALASYYVSADPGLKLNLTYIATFFDLSPEAILPYNNRTTLPSKDVISAGSRINIPLLSCSCLQDGSFLGQTFSYTTINGDTYNKIASVYYANLTTAAFLADTNAQFSANNIPTGAKVNVTVNCSCGDPDVSTEYGLFETYPIRAEENLSSIAQEFGDSESLIRSYNPGANFTAGIVFVPTKDQNGSFHPLPLSKNNTHGLSGGGIAGISVAVIIVVLGLGSYLYFGVYKKKKTKMTQLIPVSFGDKSTSLSTAAMDPGLTTQDGSTSLLTGFTLDKSVEFSYDELARATNDFSMANKIGEGGFGVVYYAELRGEKAAIKKMDMEASREFLAELKVLTHVHHLNLVRLIGYCTDFSLFLVYEFIENGNLSQHLRGSDRGPLEWSTRVQVALDSARGLEYIHEHTVPVYIHRDIKSANILLDKKFHAKVADFGLTKLTQAGGMTQPTRLVGTFGYMPPEYAQFGDVSPKIDVYAFGVVLYELISAKEAIIKTGNGTESIGLVALFEDALNRSDPKEHLKKLVDPRLGDNYSLDSVHKMALLAKACTQENAQLRPSMRTIVVALVTLSSTTEEWDVGSFYDNHAMVNLMSGR